MWTAFQDGFPASMVFTRTVDNRVDDSTGEHQLPTIVPVSSRSRGRVLQGMCKVAGANPAVHPPSALTLPPCHLVKHLSTILLMRERFAKQVPAPSSRVPARSSFPRRNVTPAQAGAGIQGEGNGGLGIHSRISNSPGPRPMGGGQIQTKLPRWHDK